MTFKWVLFFFIIVFFSCTVKKSIHQTDAIQRDGITVTLTGTTKKLYKGKGRVDILSENYKQTYWSDSIRNNKFSGKIIVPASGFYQLRFEGEYPVDSLPTGFLHTVNLYLEDGVKYNIDAGTSWNILWDKAKVYSSSSIQDELSLYDKNFFAGVHQLRSSVGDKQYELAELLDNNPGKKNLELLRKEIALGEETAKQYKGKFVRAYVMQHPGSIVAIHKLSQLYENEIKENYIQYLDIYSHLDGAIKYTADGILFKKTLDSVMKK